MKLRRFVLPTVALCLLLSTSLPLAARERDREQPRDFTQIIAKVIKAIHKLVPTTTDFIVPPKP